MRAYDFSPLFRSIVGFDRLSNLLDAALSQGDEGQGYPPYNIVKLGDNEYRITMAVAGFGERDLEVVAEQNTLTVRGRNQRDEDKTGNGNAYLYRGIAGRSFERRFQLADHIKVTNANLVNGLLSIDLVRELPEAMKPRTIQISAGGQTAQPTQIEAEARKAA